MHLLLQYLFSLYFAKQFKIPRQVVKAFCNPTETQQLLKREMAEDAEGDFVVGAQDLHQRYDLIPPALRQEIDLHLVLWSPLNAIIISSYPWRRATTAKVITGSAGQLVSRVLAALQLPIIFLYLGPARRKLDLFDEYIESFKLLLVLLMLLCLFLEQGLLRH